MNPPTPAKKSRRKKRGPKAERVRIKGDWTDAMKKALEKKRPAEGWPVAPAKDSK